MRSTEELRQLRSFEGKSIDGGRHHLSALQTAPLYHLVSVITPTYNAAAVIARAIHAVAAQTVPVLEHIVSDDGSRDDTFELIQSLRREYHTSAMCSSLGAAQLVRQSWHRNRAWALHRLS